LNKEADRTLVHSSLDKLDKLNYD